ncbi:MAG: acyltransferase family protein, partial [Promethearchaeota archaeon]
MTNVENLHKTEQEKDSAEIDVLGPDKKTYWQIDLLKVFAMMLVIMDHSIPHSLLHEIASPYWQRIAIPLFLIITGFNWAKSMEKDKDKPLRQLFSWNGYFKKKLLRFILPFGIIYAMSIVFALIISPLPDSSLQNIAYYDDPVLKLILFLPVWGPGNWYIPVLFGILLIFPIIYKAFSKLPVVSLIVCFIVEYGWYTIIFLLRVVWAMIEYTPLGAWNYYNTLTILRCTPFRALSAIGLGIWLSQNHKWNSLRNIFIWIYGILSGIYLFFFTFRDFRFTVNVFEAEFTFFTGDYSMLHFGWSAMLILIALNIFPKEPAG